MEATSAGHPEVVKLLIEKGANVNAGTAYGDTALNRALDQEDLLSDPDKARRYIPPSPPPDRDKQEVPGEPLIQQKDSAELYPEEETDTDTRSIEEKKAACAEIVKMLREAGAV
jgi:hypothetical protein